MSEGTWEGMIESRIANLESTINKSNFSAGVSLRAEFMKKFPKQITLDYKCYVELSEGQDDCVWDKNKPDDCVEASDGAKKEDCEYWRKETIQATYSADELWEWIDKNSAS